MNVFPQTRPSELSRSGPAGRLLLVMGWCMCMALVIGLWPWHAWGADDRASEQFAAGLEAARSGNLELAIKRWTAVIKRNPRSYAAYVNRGTAYMRLGFVLKAVSDWHKARELSPLFAYAVYSGPFIQESTTDRTMLNFVVSVELDSEHIASVVLMGSTYLDIGATDKAKELFRKSIDLTKNPLLKSRFEHWVNSLETDSPP